MSRSIKLSIGGQEVVITAQDWPRIKVAADRALDGMTTRERLSSGEFSAMVFDGNPRTQRFNDSNAAAKQTDC